ncbi:hypothetical protein bwei_1969 [Bacillus mycoides]|nr:hypothetical protein bwei_1969 [Bacillus mycoides]EEL05645.1 hypothetical protein bcere0014_28490 [Bacillus cereus BDRD-ST196]
MQQLINPYTPERRSLIKDFAFHIYIFHPNNRAVLLVF